MCLPQLESFRRLPPGARHTDLILYRPGRKVNYSPCFRRPLSLSNALQSTGAYGKVQADSKENQGDFMKKLRGWLIFLLILTVCSGGVRPTLRLTAEYPALGEPASHPVNQVPGMLPFLILPP